MKRLAPFILACLLAVPAYAGIKYSYSPSSSTTTPGGSDTNVQFNDAGTMSGEAEMAYDKTNDRLELSKAGTGVRLLTRNSTNGSAAALGAGSSFSYLQFDDDRDFMIASQSDPTAAPTSGESVIYVVGGVTDRVGIGSNNAGPVTTLDVLGDISATNSGTVSGLRLYEPSGSGSNYSRFITQAQAADLTYTLPAAHSSGVLTNNGSGTLTWASASGIGGSTGSTDNRALRADGTGGATLQNSYLRLDDNGDVIVFDSSVANYFSLVPSGTYPRIALTGGSAFIIKHDSNQIWFGNGGSGHTLRWYTDDGNNNTTMYPSSGNFYIEQVSSTTSKDLILTNPGSGVFGLQVEGATTIAGALKLTPTASPPGSPASGDIYVDSSPTPDELCFYDGAAWQGISSGTDANCA